MYDIIIIGGGTAGLTAAVYACRAGKKTIVFEGESIGGQISSSPKVENYPGIPLISGMDFSDRLMEQAESLGAEIEFQNVEKIEKNTDGSFSVIADTEFSGKTLILALGSRHRHLGIEREEELSGKGVSYCAICDGAFYKGKTVAVVGGGSAALQSAEFLCGIAEKVYLIHRRDEFRGEAVLAERVLSNSNIEFIGGAEVIGLGGDDMLQSITVKTRGGDRNIEVSGLFIAIGQEPQTALVKDFVRTDEAGYIEAGEDCKTSENAVFAAGDCRTKEVRQLVTAAADGAVSALSCVKIL